MKRLVIALLALLVAGGCTARQEAMTAHAVGLAVDTAGERVAQLEQKAGLDAIADVRAQAEAEERAPTEAELNAATDDVEAQWRPVYRAYDAFGAAHGVWVALLDSGRTITPQVLRSVLATWCALKELVVEFGVELPPLLPCEAG